MLQIDKTVQYVTVIIPEGHQSIVKNNRRFSLFTLANIS